MWVQSIWLRAIFQRPDSCECYQPTLSWQSAWGGAQQHPLQGTLGAETSIYGVCGDSEAGVEGRWQISLFPHPVCLCCDLRCVTNSKQFGVLAPTSRYPSVVQCLVVDATFATILPLLSCVTGLRLSGAHVWMPTSILLPSTVLRLPSALVPHLLPQHCKVQHNIIISTQDKGFLHSSCSSLSFPKTASMVCLFALIPPYFSFKICVSYLLLHNK